MNNTTSLDPEFPRMTTMNMPKRKEADGEPPAFQTRPTLHRYRLQVDRQTKASFEDKAAAEKAAKVIKKAHPVVQVVVYDAEIDERLVLDEA